MGQDRRAWLVGVPYYDFIRPALSWPADDALAMYEVLRAHANGDANYACHVTLGAPPATPGAQQEPELHAMEAAPVGSPDVQRGRVTFNSLRAALKELLDFDGLVVFYYSGHGIRINGVSYLATQDGTPTLPGVRMSEVLAMANASRAREVLLIIDSCFSGAVGEPSGDDDIAHAYLRPGVTLLAASLSEQAAKEEDGHGVFTQLVLGALRGGATDVRGRVSAASIYAYVEQALGPWDQRPIYLSNATQLSLVRYCTPEVTDEQLRRLLLYFPTPEHQYPLDPAYEVTSPSAIPEHVAIFKLFKKFQVTRLLRAPFDADLYFAAMNWRPVELTPLGQFYWRLAKANLLGESPTQNPVSGDNQMPDPESLAKLFHETYERLAPAFRYETREATRVRWEDVPEQNRHLMIATAAEVLATLYPPDAPPSAPTGGE